MQLLQCRVTLFALTVLSANIAQAAGSTLLASFDAGVGVGRPYVDDWHSPVLFYNLGVQPDDVVVLFENIAIPPSSPAIVADSISAEDDPDFQDLTALLTNGVDDAIISGAWNADRGLIGGGGGPESQELTLHVLGFGPDLVGYAVDRIARTLTVEAQSPGSDPFNDGVWTDWTVTGEYNIYGHLVPEPATCVMLALGIMLTVHRSRGISHNSPCRPVERGPVF